MTTRYSISRFGVTIMRDTLNEILDIILEQGMCPSVEIYQNGKSIGEASEYLQV